MKIFVIHSSQYYRNVIEYKSQMEKDGHEVYLPCLDTDQTKNELQTCLCNRAGIEWCDEVHMFWDGRSQGSVFDTGMAFMARKPLKLIHLNPKTFVGLYTQWEATEGDIHGIN